MLLPQSSSILGEHPAHRHRLPGLPTTPSARRVRRPYAPPHLASQPSASLGGPPPHRRLRVEAPADLERAVLLSASACMALPDLELALSNGGEGGLVTTVDRLISSVRPSPLER